MFLDSSMALVGKKTASHILAVSWVIVVELATPKASLFIELVSIFKDMLVDVPSTELLIPPWLCKLKYFTLSSIPI